jgi:hypothetical protein
MPAGAVHEERSATKAENADKADEPTMAQGQFALVNERSL